ALLAVSLSAGSTFSRTNTVPLRFSTRQHGIGLKAGAATASPVRRLKQAWCQGHRTVSPTIHPSASGPPQCEHVPPIANNSSPRRARSTAWSPTCPPTMPPSATSPNGTPRARSGPFGLGCSAMAFGIVVHCRRYDSAPRRRAGHERTTNSFDLFQFRVRKYLARRPSIVSGLRLKSEGRGLHRPLLGLTLGCDRTLEVHSPPPAPARPPPGRASR